MTQKQAFPQLKEQVIALRRAGKSRSEIKDITGIRRNQTLDEMLRGVPPPVWTTRPRAKDELRARARDLRASGHTYDEIASELGVSKGSVSLWVRDQPRTGRLSYAEFRKRNADGVAAYWDAQRELRAARRQVVCDEAAAQIGTLTDREILIAGSVAYWCEGSKSKSYCPRDRVVFINSDPGLILLFLRFLAAVGVAPDRLICQVHIHESADVEAAQRFWRDVTGVPADQFRRPLLKRHNPKTVRKNTGEQYRGCLRIEVRRGAYIYRQIEGWAAATMAATQQPTQVA
ncbi:MAG: helix-turn-helix domain-containing protein [Streptosporangiaceae bacterium]